MKFISFLTKILGYSPKIVKVGKTIQAFGDAFTQFKEKLDEIWNEPKKKLKT